MVAWLAKTSVLQYSVNNFYNLTCLSMVNNKKESLTTPPHIV